MPRKIPSVLVVSSERWRRSQLRGRHGGCVTLRVRRGGFPFWSSALAFFSRLPRCLVEMEACATAHRELPALGHEVRLMPAQYVKAYVKRNKNDAADAEPRDHFCRSTIAPRPSSPTTWNDRYQCRLRQSHSVLSQPWRPPRLGAPGQFIAGGARAWPDHPITGNRTSAGASVRQRHSLMRKQHANARHDGRHGRVMANEIRSSWAPALSTTTHDHQRP